jgi:hypothetical protein
MLDSLRIKAIGSYYYFACIWQMDRDAIRTYAFHLHKGLGILSGNSSFR